MSGIYYILLLGFQVEYSYIPVAASEPYHAVFAIKAHICDCGSLFKIKLEICLYLFRYRVALYELTCIGSGKVYFIAASLTIHYHVV